MNQEQNNLNENNLNNQVQEGITALNNSNPNLTSIPLNNSILTQNNSVTQTSENVNILQPQQSNNFNTQINVEQPTTSNINENLQSSMEKINNSNLTQNNSITQTSENVNILQPQQSNNFNTQINVEQPTTSNINENLQSSMEQINPTIQQSTNNQGDFVNQQSDVNNDIDYELLKYFIGNNYHKIISCSFNFAGFFFGTFYMFYRKMFLYGIIASIINLVVLNLIDSYIVTILFGIIVGFFVNQLYLHYAKNKIKKIKAKNIGKDLNEIKAICISKGGTSIVKMFLYLFAMLAIVFVVAYTIIILGILGTNSKKINLGNLTIKINDNKIGSNESGANNNSKKTTTLVKDVVVDGHACFDSKCIMSIVKADNTNDYYLEVKNKELFKRLGDYKDYIKLNIYYTQDGNKKTIVDYKMYSKSTSQDISNVSSENELRKKLGLYSLGVHTGTFKLKKIGEESYGYSENKPYHSIKCIFIDNKNNEYEMTYVTLSDSTYLIEGVIYKITFEVVNGIFNYEINIKTIE